MSRKNYTEREKQVLLEIVSKYKSIIENKTTNAVFIQKKNDTWQNIAVEFNAGAEYPRTAKQLTTAYQNMKRLTRQKVADENMQKYLIKKEELNQFKKENAKDKKEIKTTGGGYYTPALSENGAQMLALLMDQQLKPLPNSCDSAAEYYSVEPNVVIESVEVGGDMCLSSPSIPFAPSQTIEINTIAQDKPSEILVTTPSRIAPPPRRKVKIRDEAKVQKKIKPKSTEAFKRIYFKRKCQNAYLEKKKLMQEILFAKQQHNLKMEILKKELNSEQ